MRLYEILMVKRDYQYSSFSFFIYLNNRRPPKGREAYKGLFLVEV